MRGGAITFPHKSRGPDDPEICTTLSNQEGNACVNQHSDHTVLGGENTPPWATLTVTLTSLTPLWCVLLVEVIWSSAEVLEDESWLSRSLSLSSMEANTVLSI